MDSGDWCFSILFICIATTLIIKHISRSWTWKIYYDSLKKCKNKCDSCIIEKPKFD